MAITATTISLSCSSDSSKEESGSSIVAEFLNNTSSLESIEGKNLIANFEELARAEADEILDLSKDNIQDVLSTSKNYKSCIIIVEDHTIVKIANNEDCKQSGSWGACMPLVEGYIKRGDLDPQNDYMNNVIGLPDSKKRTAYLFK